MSDILSHCFPGLKNITFLVDDKLSNMRSNVTKYGVKTRVDRFHSTIKPSQLRENVKAIDNSDF